MEDKLFSVTQKIIARVVEEKDQYIKDVIVDYAKNYYNKTGERIEIYFIDKDIADEIIDLGIKAYKDKKRVAFN